MSGDHRPVAALTWRAAMSRALYGPGGFFLRHAPGSQFRTSVHASPLFAAAVARLVTRVDAVLGCPGRVDVVDVGAGRGELLAALAALLPDERFRFVAVEVAGRPVGLPARVGWAHTVPPRTTGVLIATEWLDNVPVDVVALDTEGAVRLVCTDDTLGPPADRETVAWLEEWWPDLWRTEAGEADIRRAEPGLPRDVAWRKVTAGHTGVALAVDYGHTRDARPVAGTLTGYRDGRQVLPRLDGSTDITAHVAMDSLAPGGNTVLLRQREALHALGVVGSRPPLSLAAADPERYLRELAVASQAAELTDLAGLGGHWWLFQGLGVDVGRCVRE